MEFDEDFISCEPAHIGMVPKSVERRADEFIKKSRKILNPYKRQFQKLELRAIVMDVEA
jgi:hypothetical protein